MTNLLVLLHQPQRCPSTLPLAPHTTSLPALKRARGCPGRLPVFLIHGVLAAANAADRAQEAAARRERSTFLHPRAPVASFAVLAGAAAVHALQGESGGDSFVSVGTVSGPNIYVEIEISVVWSACVVSVRRRCFCVFLCASPQFVSARVHLLGVLASLYMKVKL